MMTLMGRVTQSARAIFTLGIVALTSTQFGLTASAQTEAPNGSPVAGDPATAAPPTGETQGAVASSLGSVSIRKNSTPAWVAAGGVVVTSDYLVDSPGVRATFTLDGSAVDSPCYVAVHLAEMRLSILRCTQLDEDGLTLERSLPPIGASVVAPFRSQNASDSSRAFVDATVLDNAVEFMGHKRLRFSYDLGVTRATNVNIGDSSAAATVGIPVLSSTGSVVGVIIAVPEDGGTPLGITAKELTEPFETALAAPDSFTSAAAVTVGRRCLIALAAGLIAGLPIGLVARRNIIVRSMLGLAFGFVAATIGFSVLLALAVGPESLLG